MSDTPAFGFGKFVPGFDFLQTLSQSAAKQGHAGARSLPSGMPDWSQWVAPTLQVEEIDKRINELRTVQFWLEQNARALAATIQALEVQKMTLDTLKGMNLQMSDLAGAFGFKGAPAAPAPEAAPTRGSGPGPYDDMFTRGRAAAAAAQAGAAAPQAEAPPPVAPAAAPFAQPAPPVAEPEAATASALPPAADASAPGASPVDPLQWWNALTGQFQQIAASALQDAAQHARTAPGAQLADAARQAFAAAGARATGKIVAGKPAAKAPVPPPPSPRAAAKAAGTPLPSRKAAAAKKPTRAKPATKAPGVARGRNR